MNADPTVSHLACGCLIGFRPGAEGSPVTVMIDRKAESCAIPSHVTGLPVFDHREALRPATRQLPAAQPDYGDDG